MNLDMMVKYWGFGGPVVPASFAVPAQEWNYA